MSERRPCARRLTLALLPAAKEDEAEALHSEQGFTAPGTYSLAGVRHNYGSRFWALADEVSSDEEEEIDGRTSPSSSSQTTNTIVRLQGFIFCCRVRANRSGGCSVTKPWRGPLPAK